MDILKMYNHIYRIPIDVPWPSENCHTLHPSLHKSLTYGRTLQDGNSICILWSLFALTR